jgi:DNA-binding MarR family transcriptional regulator
MRQVVDLMSRTLDTRMSAFGLTDAQWRPLLALSYGGDCKATQIARLIGCDNGASTRMIDRLVDKGMVVRVRNDHDRRAVQVELTPDGQDAARVVPYVIADVLNGFLADLSTSELEQLGDFLRRILNAGRTETVVPQESEKP